MSQSKKLTILVVSIDAVGHINSCAGTLAAFLDRGYRVVFLIDESYRGKLATFGYEEYVVPLSHGPANANSGENLAKTLFELKVIGPYPPEEKYRRMLDIFASGEIALGTLRRMNEHSKQAIEKFQPDLIFVDGAIPPVIFHSGIPWVNNVSLGPLMWGSQEFDELPPSSSGFSCDRPHDEQWQRFKQLNRDSLFSSKYHDLIEKELGYPRYPQDRIMPLECALLNVYGTPEEWNWPQIKTMKNWFNLEVFNKKHLVKELFELKDLLPEGFIHDTLGGKWSGKWVYLSMGSMGAVDLELMARILDATGSTLHKYIVSKGPRHQEYQLPANAWGDRFLPQMKLLPLVDLVITHGGNNTVTETFAQGKVMIVMPLFGDQYDNAQRLQETGYGGRIEPYEFTKQELVDKINTLIKDQEIRERCEKASRRILAEDRHSQLVDKVEQLLGLN